MRSKTTLLRLVRTLMIISNIDLNSEGLTDGSRIVAEDWNDWNKSAISLEMAKLFRKSTCVDFM